MQSKKLLSVLVSLGVSSLFLACSTENGPNLTGSGKNKVKGKSEVKPYAESQVQNEASVDKVETKPQTEGSTKVDAKTPEQVVQATKPAIEQKYANYTNPTTDQINDPTNITLYNGSKEGIVAVNGRKLEKVVPPGKAYTMPKLYSDIDEMGTYNLAIETDAGRKSSATFDPSDVDEAGWKAGIEPSLEIKQNAGGGGGGGAGKNRLNNFVSDNQNSFGPDLLSIFR